MPLKSSLLVILLLIFLPQVSMADSPFDHWHWRSPLPQGNTLWGVTYGNNIFVAVGDVGTILTSPDGVDWTIRTSGTTYWLDGVTFGNNTFVAVGNDGTILTSTDGVSWTSRTSGATKDLYGISFANNTFIAVGDGGIILTSPDGANWTIVAPGTMLSLTAVTYGNNTFVAVGVGGTILTSPDGASWTWRISGTTNNLNGVTYGNNTFVAVGLGGTILTSSDGVSWTSGTSSPPVSFYGVAYGNNTFIAVAKAGDVFTSQDGVTWTWRPQGVVVENFYGVIYGNGIFVTVGLDGAIMISPDGEDWFWGTEGATWSDAFTNLYGVTYGNNTFVAVGIYDTIMTSTDGTDWIPRTSGTNNSPMRVTYGNNTFVAVGWRIIVTSPDGVNWTIRSSETTPNLDGVTYGNNMFVAVGWENQQPFNSAILTSPDGVNWTPRPPGTTQAFKAVTYGNNMFVAVGWGSIILTSPDGVNWTQRTAGITAHILNGVTYGNNMFVAVGSGGDIITSTDGENWTKRTSGTTRILMAVAYGNNTFIAVGDAGMILTSPDGVNWTKRTSGTANDLFGVIYGNNTFVVVGQNSNKGIILQSDPLLCDPPGTPSSPSPSNGATEVSSSLTLSWESAANTESYDVYFGTSTDPPYVGNTMSTSYPRSGLSSNTTYYWKIVARNACGDLTLGPIWTFTSSVNYTLTVTKAGTGSGMVTSSPAGIDCGSDCSEAYDQGTSVTLTPTPYSASTFAGWSGACSGTDPCIVSMTSDKTVTATFALKQYTLTVTKAGTGSGTVTSSPAGINCGADCSEAYDEWTSVRLTSTPDEGSTFTGWSGACSGSGTCTVYMASDKAVTATFTLQQQQQYTLTVTKSGTGSGTVTSSPAGINCGADCSETYNQGTSVTLISTPDAGSTFTGWSGACSGAGACIVSMTSDKAVTATFTWQQQQQYTLTVTKSGTGSGTVTSSPAGINCGDDCSEIYTKITKVKLTAKADANSTFAGWSGGGCSGTKTCSVTVDTALTATADFAKKTPDISVDQTPINFGDIKVGKKATKTLKIMNNGTGDLMMGVSLSDETDFNIQGSRSVIIKSKKSCALKILFAPKTAGSKTATLNIGSNDPDTPELNIALSGSSGVQPQQYDGSWSGSTSEGQVFSFTVSNNGIASIKYGIFCIIGYYSTETSFNPPRQIIGNTFSVSDTMFVIDPRTVSAVSHWININGTFHSTTSASGSLEISGSVCDSSVTWNATK